MRVITLALAALARKLTEGPFHTRNVVSVVISRTLLQLGSLPMTVRQRDRFIGLSSSPGGRLCICIYLTAASLNEEILNKHARAARAIEENEPTEARFPARHRVPDFSDNKQSVTVDPDLL